MTPIEVLEIALEKESESIGFYRKIALEHSALTELAEALINEEEKHKKMIEKRIFKLKSS